MSCLDDLNNTYLHKTIYLHIYYKTARFIPENLEELNKKIKVQRFWTDHPERNNFVSIIFAKIGPFTNNLRHSIIILIFFHNYLTIVQIQSTLVKVNRERPNTKLSS